MSSVVEISGYREIDGVIKYKCIMNNNKTKWLSKAQIPNFNSIHNKYADKEKVSEIKLKRIADETAIVYKYIA